jgi:hypothetical protein
MIALETGLEKSGGIVATASCRLVVARKFPGQNNDHR